MFPDYLLLVTMLVSFNNIAINVSQYSKNDLNTSILYSCQHAWGTLQISLAKHMDATTDVGFFP